MAETYEDLIELGLGQRVPSEQWERNRLNQLYFRNKNRHFYQRGVTDGNYSISSATFADIDATNLACNLVTTGNPVRVQLFAGLVTVSAGFAALQILVDSVALLGGNDMLRIPTGSTAMYLNFQWVIPVLAGSHDFKMQFRQSSGTFTMTDDNGIWFEVCEI